MANRPYAIAKTDSSLYVLNGQAYSLRVYKLESVFCDITLSIEICFWLLSYQYSLSLIFEFEWIQCK